MIRLISEAHVATVVLDRPPVNAIDRDWVEDMSRVLGQVESSEQVSVLLLKSACKSFCAGADISLMQGLLVDSAGIDAMLDVIRKMQRIFDRIENIGAITVAEMGGAAVGGGLELALACDLRVCSESARLGLPEAGLGLIPGAGGTQRLTRLCGEALARRLILGAELVDGREAARLGLVHWVVAEDRLPGFTEALIARLSSLPRQAVAAGKRCIAARLDASVDGYERELSETRALYGDADTRQRLQAFLQKSARR